MPLFQERTPTLNQDFCELYRSLILFSSHHGVFERPAGLPLGCFEMIFAAL